MFLTVCAVLMAGYPVEDFAGTALLLLFRVGGAFRSGVFTGIA